MLKRLLPLTLLAGLLATISVVWLQARPGEAQTDASTAPCAGVKVGPADEVVSNASKQEKGLKGWADTAFGVLPAGEGRYDFLAVAALAGGDGYNQSIAVTRGTLADPAADGVQHMAPVNGLPAGYDYGGGGPVYRDPESGIILQMLHLEQSTPDGFYSTLHLGRYDPDTQETTYLGPLATPRATKSQIQQMHASADMGTPAFTVRDGYLYVHFPDYSMTTSGGFASTALSAARAPLVDVLDAAAEGDVVKWSKYLDGQWNSPAVGGASTDLRPGQRGAWHPNVVRTVSGGSLLVQGVSSTEFVLSNSTDGVVSWSAAVPLFNDPDKFNAYPTVVGTGADPSVVGNEFYVYYLQWNSVTPDWENAHMMRRLVTCTQGQSLGSVPLVRADKGTRHQVTTEPVTDFGYYPTRTWMLEAGEKPGTVPVFSCRGGTRDQFVSTVGNCEGSSFLQTLGWIYSSPPAAPSVALYRCRVAGLDDHYLSAESGCENPKAVSDGRIGYALSTTKVAFSRFDSFSERWVTSGPVSSSYGTVKRWYIEGSQQAGTRALYGCSYAIPGGTNHFISTDLNCEGHQKLRTEGWISTSKTAEATAPLYRCYQPDDYDHFLGDAECDGVEGAQREGLMGYAVP